MDLSLINTPQFFHLNLILMRCALIAWYIIGKRHLKSFYDAAFQNDRYID